MRGCGSVRVSTIVRTRSGPAAPWQRPAREPLAGTIQSARRRARRPLIQGMTHAHHIRNIRRAGADPHGHRRLPGAGRTSVGGVCRSAAARALLGAGDVAGDVHPARHGGGRPLALLHDGPGWKPVERLVAIPGGGPGPRLRGGGGGLDARLRVGSEVASTAAPVMFCSRISGRISHPKQSTGSRP